MRNLHAINDDVSWHPKLEEAHKILLADAQTSGCLLIAIPPEDQNALSQALARDTGREITTIGRIKALTTPLITVLADETCHVTSNPPVYRERWGWQDLAHPRSHRLADEAWSVSGAPGR